MNPKSRSELFNPHKEEAASGFPIHPSRPKQGLKHMSTDQMQNPTERISHSGSLAPGVSWSLSGRKKDDSSIVSTTRSNISTLSGPVASRVLSAVESRDPLNSSHVEAMNQVGRFSGSFGDQMTMQDRRRQMKIFSGSQQAGNCRISTKDGFMVSFLFV